MTDDKAIARAGKAYNKAKAQANTTGYSGSARELLGEPPLDMAELTAFGAQVQAGLIEDREDSYSIDASVLRHLRDGRRIVAD